MSASPQQVTENHDRLQWAARALDDGVQALVEAERDGASHGEILRLCDEVIARRLRIQAMNIRAGRPASRRLLVQMARDRELLHEPAELDD